LTVVPKSVSEDEFWVRYYFCIAEIELAQQTRADLVVDTVENDDDFTWSSDEEKEEVIPSSKAVDEVVEVNSTASHEPITDAAEEGKETDESFGDAHSLEKGNVLIAKEGSQTSSTKEQELPLSDPAEVKEMDDGQNIQVEDQHSGSSFDIVEKPQISPTTLAVLEKDEEWGGWD
jgi:hypothetical protein